MAGNDHAIIPKRANINQLNKILMKSTMNSISNNRGNTTILDRGVHSGQKVDVKGLPNVGKVIAADFENETVTVEIEVPVGKVLESE